MRERADGPGSQRALDRGLLLVVVGPSGAGKDSLIAYARGRLGDEPTVRFVRRIVTRPSRPDAEDHESLSPGSFLASQEAGGFAVAWRAHGLDYAIPADVLSHVRAGGIAVVNGSRAALPAIRAAFGCVMAIHVTCRHDVLAARLAARGREDAAQQQERLSRAAPPPDAGADGVEIDNSGELAAGGEALVAVICGALAGRATNR